MSAARAPPPRLHFDDGSRVMLADGGGTAAAANRRTAQDDDNAVEGTNKSAAAVATSDRDHAVPLDEYYEVGSTCDEIVRRLNLVEKIRRLDGGGEGGDDGFLCRVALQFPDQLLPDAAEVCWRVEDGIVSSLRRSLGDSGTNVNEHPVPEPLVFVLGDTTHGSCCVDEVAAMHLDADLVVHYGPACLTSAPSVPVIYRFGRAALDVESCARSILDELHRTGDCEDENDEEEASGVRRRERRVLLLYDVRYHHAVDALASRLSSRDYDRGMKVDVVVGRIPDPPRPHRRSESKLSSCCNDDSSPSSNRAAGTCCAGTSAEVDGPHADDGTGNESSVTCGQSPSSGADEIETCRLTPPTAPIITTTTIGGLEILPLADGASLSDHVMVYIGGGCRVRGGHGGTAPQQQLVNILLRCSGAGGTRACWVYDPSASTLHTDAASTCSRDLARRFYQTQKARMATVFGIVVGTLGASRFRDVVETLRTKIRDAGKASYVLAVGKVNVAKLANFAEVECFVFVGCPETSSGLLLSELGREFHVPVITPLELDVALGCREWDGFYSNDFADFLGGGRSVEGGDAGEGSAGRGDGVTTEEDDHDDDGDDDDDAPYFSLISGRYESSGTTRARQPAADCRADDVADETSAETAGEQPGGGPSSGNDGQIAVYRSEAAEFLRRREYRGLTSDIGRSAVAPAKEGRVGIASDYGESR